MAEFKGRATHKNLIAAFTEEAAALSRCLYFSKIAEIEGRPGIAQFFRDLAEGGVCNAHGCLDFLRLEGDPLTGAPIGETDRNLRAALLAETREFAESYPAMAAEAHAEGFPDIASWFETLAKLKRSHAQQISAALARLDGEHAPGEET